MTKTADKKLTAREQDDLAQRLLSRISMGGLCITVDGQLARDVVAAASALSSFKARIEELEKALAAASAGDAPSSSEGDH